MNKFLLALFQFFLLSSAAFALKPNEILIIANSDSNKSLDVAEYYCAKRNVPQRNILALPLGTELTDTISRNDYDELLVKPIKKKLSAPVFNGKIKCLLTVYGVPIKVGPRGTLHGVEKKLSELQHLYAHQEKKLKELDRDESAKATAEKKQINHELTFLQAQINPIIGRETNASVDSELAMLLHGDYELYRWQPNVICNRYPIWDTKSLMVCRLDGPNSIIAKSLVDKSIIAEKTGLKGKVYIDSGYSKVRKGRDFDEFDESLHNTALIFEHRTNFKVVEEQTEKLFEKSSCPKTAIYCGWYSLGKYIDSFDFADGAIGYHIASFEAVNLRDPNSTQWCPSMLRHGITATLGATAEPYLHTFPRPKEFFNELLSGFCLVEAYYRSCPFNSWHLILIGDPLYRPFK